MKQKYSFFFPLQTIIPFLITINSYAQFSEATGSLNDPYTISTLEDLKTLSENSAYWGSNFQLSQNIDSTDTKNWNSGEDVLSLTSK